MGRRCEVQILVNDGIVERENEREPERDSVCKVITRQPPVGGKDDYDSECVLLCFINSRVRKIKNEASSCLGIFSRTLRFYIVASSPGAPLPLFLTDTENLLDVVQFQQSHAQGQFSIIGKVSSSRDILSQSLPLSAAARPLSCCQCDLLGLLPPAAKSRGRWRSAAAKPRMRAHSKGKGVHRRQIVAAPKARALQQAWDDARGHPLCLPVGVPEA